MRILSVFNAGADTDRFLVQDGTGAVKFRTGAEVASDIGAANIAASQLKHTVKAAVALTKGQAVYVSGADGTNMLVSKSSNASESTSTKTMGLIDRNLAINDMGDVITEGLLAGLNTSTATIGDPVWLGVDGNLLYGVANKPVAPAHMVFIGIVTRVQTNNGEIFVKVQNGFELEELHNVLITGTPVDKAVIQYDTASGLWKNSTLGGVTASTGTAGQVAYFTGATTQAGSNNLFWDNTNARLGIGTNAPTQILDIAPATGSPVLRVARNGGTDFRMAASVTAGGGIFGTYTASPISFYINAATAMTLDVSGNLGLGVVPSAWSYSGSSVLQIKNASLFGVSNDVGLVSNAYYNTGFGGWFHIATARAAIYSQISGQHQWFTSTSGTAGTAVSLTQAMTLTTANNLLIGSTSDSTERLQVTGTAKITGATSITAVTTIGADTYKLVSISDAGGAGWKTNGAGNAPIVYLYQSGASGIVQTYINGTTRFEVTNTGFTATGNGIVTGNLTVDTNTLFVDATNNRVGIGTVTPSRTLQVEGTGLFTDNLTVQKNFIGSTTISVGNLGTIDATTLMQFALSEDGSTVNGYFRRYRNGTGLTEIGFSNSLAFTGAVTGTAAERMRIDVNGNVGIGSTVLTGINLRVSKTITGATTSYGILNDGVIQPDVTSIAGYNRVVMSKAVGAATSIVVGYWAVQGTYSGTVDTQYGYLVDSTLTGATNNYAFFSNIASGTGRWNLYMNGTADNYLAGRLGIGTTSLVSTTLNVGRNLTGGTVAYSVYSGGSVANDVTNVAISYYSRPSLLSGTTLNSLVHYTLDQGTFTGTVTNQIAFSTSVLTGGTNNFGFYGEIASGNGRWNLYCVGTANNYMAGNTGIGTTGTTERLVVRAIGNSYANSAALSIENSTGANKTYLTNANGVFYISNSTSLDHIILYANGNFSVDGSTLFVDATDNEVGIGTTNPLYTFHTISANSTIGAFRQSGAALGQLLVGNTVADLQLRILASGDAIIFSDTGRYMAFGSSGAERMRIDTAGNVGIGVTAPNVRLDVNGSLDLRNAFQGYARLQPSAGNTAQARLSIRLKPVDTAEVTLGSFTQDGSFGLGGNITDIISMAGAYFSVASTGRGRLNSYGAGTFTGTVAYNLAVDASGNIIETAGGVVDGSGTANYIPKWSDANTLGNSLIFDNGTNVGIGTATPSGKLDVSNAGDVSIWATATSAGSASLYLSPTGGGFGQLTTLGATHLRLGTNGTERVRITATGDVGVGISAPSFKFHVVGNAAVGASTGGSFSITTNQINGTIASPLNMDLNFLGYADGVRARIRAVDQSGNTNASYLSFLVNTNAGSLNEYMRLDALGNLGIGTTSPTRKLDIVSTGPQIRISDGVGSTYWEFSSTFFQTNEDLFIQNQNGIAVTINASGNFGIGTNNPAQKLHVIGTESRFGGVASGFISVYNATNRSGYLQANQAVDFRIASDTDPMTFYVGGSERMRIDASGNLGLAVTPSAWTSIQRALEISYAGNSIYTGSGANNFGITSNAYFSTGWKYGQNGFANRINFGNADGSFAFFTAPSGTAGNAITFTQAMTLTADGNLGINIATPNFTSANRKTIDINGATSAAVSLSAGGTNYAYLYADSIAAIFGATGNYPLSLQTNSTTRFQITGGGNVLIGSTSDTTEKLQVTGTAKITGNVGIGTASDVLYPLKVERSTAGVGIQVYNSTTYSQIRLQSSGTNQSSYLTFNPTGTGKAVIQVSDTDRLTIDTSGNVGIGIASPATKLDIFDSTTTQLRVRMSGQADMRVIADTGYGAISNESNMPLVFRTNATERMRIDATGNLGIGVVPSAIGSSYKALQIGNSLTLMGASGAAEIGNNNFYNGTSYLYITNSQATLYALSAGQHRWYSAITGTAGNAITFTQAMTLDASGNLIVGGTSVYGATITSYATAGRSGGIGIRNSAGTIAGGFFTYAAGSGSGSTDIAVESTGFMMFSAAGAERMRLTATNGNLHIGGTGDTGEKLQVTGTAKITGVLSLGSNLSVVNGFTINSAGSNNLIGAQTTQAAAILAISNLYTSSRLTAGTQSTVDITNTFNPTSGPALHHFLSLTFTVNQTGGANGITRGIYLNAILTAAADFRGIEWTNNTGWGLYGVGSASNYLQGSLGIGTASINASAKLQVDSTTQGFLPPRMTSTQRSAISSPSVGLVVYQTDGVEGLYIYTNANGWKSLAIVN